jgi:carbon-monoxide dehydrogenase iron sulfur subunit
MAVCPTGAISRATDADIVVVDDKKCITCALCAMVCPFDVICYYQSAAVKRDRAVALKCDHCIERQGQGQIPACVEVCKVGALEFGEINELIKSASTRLAKLVSVAVGEIEPELPSLPANIEAWRAFGESLDQVNEG